MPTDGAGCRPRAGPQHRPSPLTEDPAFQCPADVLRGLASRWIAGTAYHCYSGAAAARTELHAEFPDKGIWVTECSGSHGPGEMPGQIFAGTLDWQARNLLIDSLRNWARAVLTWNLALDEVGGPHVGGDQRHLHRRGHHPP